MVFSFNVPTPSECTCGSPDVVGTNPPALPKLHSVGRLQSVIDAVNSTFWPEAEEEEEKEERGAWTWEDLEGVQKILQFMITKLARELEELSVIQSRVEAVQAVLGVREEYTAWEARLDLAQETMVAFGMAPEPNWIKPFPGDLHDSDISSVRGPPPPPTESSDDSCWWNPGNGHKELALEESRSAERSVGSGFEEDGVWVDKDGTDEPSLVCTCGLGARVPSAPPPSMSSSRASERGSPVPAAKW